MPAELLWKPTYERPPVELEIVETGWDPWFAVFKVHHYLPDAGRMPFSTAYTGFDVATGDPVSFCGVTGMWAGQRRVARACRLVTVPEWQGAGVGMRFLDAIAEREWKGGGFIGEPVPCYMHSAHPALCGALRRSTHWKQVSQKLVGDKSAKVRADLNMRYGGHLRSVAGFRYRGAE